MKHKLLAALLLVYSFTANATVVGSMNSMDDNCFPFGCATGEGHYQQAYSFTNFSNEMTLSSLTFFGHKEPYWTNGSLVSSGTFTISLSSSYKFGLPQSENLGNDNLIVYQGQLPTLDSLGNLTIQFLQNFQYDPNSTKDLLMDITWTSASSEKRPVYFDISSGNMLSSLTGDTNFMSSNSGLVTHFGQVPEPSSISLIALSSLGLFALRRKQS